MRAIVLDPCGCVLLIRRSRRSSWEAGLWELPGGKIDHGEPLYEAVAREAREEVGLDLEVGRPVHVSHFLKEPFWVTSVAFACTASDVDAIRVGDEHVDHAWVRPQDVPSYECTAPTREALAAWTALETFDVK